MICNFERVLDKYTFYKHFNANYIDELYMDHDHGCVNMSEVRFAKRNLAFAIKRYNNYYDF